MVKLFNLRLSNPSASLTMGFTLISGKNDQKTWRLQWLVLLTVLVLPGESLQKIDQKDEFEKDMMIESVTDTLAHMFLRF